MRRIWSFFLLAVLIGFAYGGARAALNRSLIPRELEARVTRKILLPEKHPGIDDVHLLVVQPRNQSPRTYRVDKPIYETVREGELLRKRKDERHLRHGPTASLPLAPSDTATQLIRIGWLISLPAVILVVWGHWALRRTEALLG